MSDRCGEKEELSDGPPSHSVSLGMRWTVTGITQGLCLVAWIRISSGSNRTV